MSREFELISKENFREKLTSEKSSLKDRWKYITVEYPEEYLYRLNHCAYSGSTLDFHSPFIMKDSRNNSTRFDLFHDDRE